MDIPLLFVPLGFAASMIFYWWFFHWEIHYDWVIDIVGFSIPSGKQT